MGGINKGWEVTLSLEQSTNENEPNILSCVIPIHKYLAVEVTPIFQGLNPIIHFDHLGYFEGIFFNEYFVAGGRQTVHRRPRQLVLAR